MGFIFKIVLKLTFNPYREKGMIENKVLDLGKGPIFPYS